MPLRNTLRAALLAATILAPSVAAAAPQGGRPVDRPDDAVIEHVTLLPMTEGAPVLRDQTVVVRDGRIAAIRPAGRLKAPSGLPRIDGRGKWLMPGLSDMHVHVEDGARMQRMLGGAPLAPDTFRTQDILLPYVANGVLQVFNLSASPAGLAQRQEVESGHVLGPHLAQAVMLDGNPPMNPGGMANAITTAEQGRQAVREAKAAGYDAIKTYSALTYEAFTAIVDEARKLDLKVLGHIPLRGQDRTADLFQPGYSMVAHSEEFAYQPAQVDAADVPRFATLAKARGVWLVTTVELNERIVERTVEPELLKDRPELKYVHPYTAMSWLAFNNYARSQDRLARRRLVVDYNPKLVRAFHAAGVPMVTGTDTMVAGVMPGFGLHDELEALARAGLPAAAILEASTRRPAEWLGVAGDRGTAEVGKRADLILLDADPLEDVRNTRRLAAVVASGRVYRRAELDAMMTDLATRYAAMPRPDASAVKAGGHLEPDDHDE